MKTRAEYRTEINKCKTRVIELQKTIEEEKRDFTPEEKVEVDKILLDVQDFRRNLEALDLTEDKELNDKREYFERMLGTPKEKLPSEQLKELEYRQAWYDYVLNGSKGMHPENRSLLQKFPGRPAMDLLKRNMWSDFTRTMAEQWARFTEEVTERRWGAFNPELRAQGLIPTSAGGFLVPQGFSNELERQMLYAGGMRNVSRTMSTVTGNTIDWPTVDDTSAVATLVAEAGAIPEQDMVFGQIQLGAYKYTSGYVYVSWELLQDNLFNFETLLAEMFAERFTRGLNAAYTNGTGTGQPQGITVASNNTLNLAAGGAITYADVVDLKYSVNKIYRDRPGSRFMFNDAIEQILVKIVDSEGRALWQPNIQEGAPDRMLGVSYEINNDMSVDLAVGASKPPVMLYGDFNKYLIRDVAPMTMMRLDELRALNGQVVFLAWLRTDGRAIFATDNAGDTPVKGITPPAA